MKKANWIRVFCYLGILVVFIALVQWKKADVMEKRTRDVVSIPSEIEQHGWPVDVEKIEVNDFKESLQFTLLFTGDSSRRHFYMSQKQRSQVKTGAEVLSLKGDRVLGRVSFVATQPDLDNGLYRGEVQWNPKLKLDTETMSSVNIVVRTLPQRVSVPVEALQIEGDDNYLWVDHEGSAQKVQIQVGALASGRYEVLKGLEPGDRVITNGFKVLEEGVRLRVRSCLGCEGENS